jgi:hypothetical protein
MSKDSVQNVGRAGSTRRTSCMAGAGEGVIQAGNS